MKAKTVVEVLKSMSVDVRKDLNEGSYLVLDGKHINVIQIEETSEGKFYHVPSFVEDVINYNNFCKMSKDEKALAISGIVESNNINHIDKRLINCIS